MDRRIARQIPVGQLAPGDFVIGSDTKPYLVIGIEPCDDLNYVEKFDDIHGTSAMNYLKLICNNEAGQELITVVPTNSCVDAVLNHPIDPRDDYHAFGLKFCDQCGQMRSRNREWEDTDYVCKLCRAALDCEA